MVKYQKYAEYKDSGVEWLENVPREWDIIKIKHLSTVKRGASPRPIDDPKYFDDNGEYAWVRIADVSASDMYLLNTTQTMSDLGSSLSVKLEPNQLFLSIAGTVGKPCINKIKACIHDGFVYFPELKIPNKYLFYVFAGEQAYKGLGKMGTQLNLNTDTVGDIKVALPKSQSDIYKIIEFLDHETTKIDHLIEKQQQLIELLKEKRQAVISHAVTKGLDPNVLMKDSGVEWLGEVPQNWTATKIGFHALKIGSGKTPKGGAEIYQDEGVLFIRSQNVYNDGLRVDNSESVYISEAIHDEMSTSKIYSGDILLNITGGSIGRSSLVPDKFPEANVNQHVCIIRVGKYLQEFLSLVIQSDLIQAQLRSIQTGGNREGLNFEQISKFWFVLPPKDEQEQIILFIKNKLNEFGKLEARANKAIQLMQERRTALISAAVTGKIDVRHWHAPTVAEAQTELSA
ncbi:restriction modification system DNA specificity domain-containing protein [Acinetobacter sp. KAM398]|uniref:restriction endonuclease subunit S n=1 Tax=Acinetobacter TaxID=469 RepID=UPI000362640C|nr:MULTISPECIES: restriction endonuclease subunit S [unclassified Acinetobacter]GJC30632.1 restriction modification system DNA specificity domain-containing protein [Acinetobacter sp. KAM392]GJC33441.1 restriction modification system DNA specificity domain-containing protein [Acinetobacter sp. KAM393]GJC36352.1 restriction modification system DNA specificity domain-containing protein [Acinetobacter sp. KAM394]GJC39089.1 restriction modification system DNA specificity domain-containing protein [